MARRGAGTSRLRTEESVRRRRAVRPEGRRRGATENCGTRESWSVQLFSAGCGRRRSSSGLLAQTAASGTPCRRARRREIIGRPTRSRPPPGLGSDRPPILPSSTRPRRRRGFPHPRTDGDVSRVQSSPDRRPGGLHGDGSRGLRDACVGRPRSADALATTSEVSLLGIRAAAFRYRSFRRDLAGSRRLHFRARRRWRRTALVLAGTERTGGWRRTN